MEVFVMKISKSHKFNVQVIDADTLEGRFGIITWDKVENINWINPPNFENLKLVK